MPFSPIASIGLPAKEYTCKASTPTLCRDLCAWLKAKNRGGVALNCDEKHILLHSGQMVIYVGNFTKNDLTVDILVQHGKRRFSFKILMRTAFTGIFPEYTIAFLAGTRMIHVKKHAKCFQSHFFKNNIMCTRLVSLITVRFQTYNLKCYLLYLYYAVLLHWFRKCLCKHLRCVVRSVIFLSKWKECENTQGLLQFICRLSITT